MPTEITDIDEFVGLSEKGEYCAVKRLEDVVKLKLRTPKKLYTLKIQPTRTDEILKKLKCETREI
jgi:ferritin-like protein